MFLEGIILEIKRKKKNTSLFIKPTIKLFDENVKSIFDITLEEFETNNIV